MVGMRLAVFALLIVAGLALSGCLQDPGDYGGAMIEASPKVISSFDCTCFLCTNSTGSWWKELRWWRNELTDGACFFKEECTLAFLTSYFDDNEKNYVREFGIGQGGSYTEFEEANLRCNFGVDYVIKVLYAKGRAPFYEKQGGWLFKDDTKEGSTIMCALEKGVIPIYVIYTEGTYLESDWIREFMKEASIEGPVFVTPEAMFDESVAEDIKGQIDAIYDGCGSERERICVEWEERTTYVDHPTLRQRATTYKECVKYDETMVRGCKVALFPKQGNPGAVSYTHLTLPTKRIV
mgnify:CR=1 FL=1